MREGRPAVSGFSRAAMNLLAVALIVLMIPAVFVLPFEMVFFQPNSYERALQNRNFYQRFAGLLAETVAPNRAVLASPGVSQQAISYLSQSDFTRFFEMVFPPDWVEGQSKGVIQNFGDYINFQRSDLVMTLDLRTPKTHLDGDQGQQIAQKIVDSWPPCTADDAAQILGLVLSGQLKGIPVCKPPDVVLPAFEQIVQASLKGIVGALPDQLDLAGPLTGDPSQPGGNNPLVTRWQQMFRWYIVLRWLFRLTPIFSLAVLVWILLLAIRSMPDLLHGIGQPILLAGLIALVIALAQLFILNPLLVNLVSNAFSLIPAAFRGVAAGVLLEVSNRTAIWSVFIALALSIVGFCLLFAVRFFEREPEY